MCGQLLHPHLTQLLVCEQLYFLLDNSRIPLVRALVAEFHRVIPQLNCLFKHGKAGLEKFDKLFVELTPHFQQVCLVDAQQLGVLLLACLYTEAASHAFEHVHKVLLFVLEADEIIQHSFDAAVPNHVLILANNRCDEVLKAKARGLDDANVRRERKLRHNVVAYAPPQEIHLLSNVILMRNQFVRAADTRPEDGTNPACEMH